MLQLYPARNKEPFTSPTFEAFLEIFKNLKSDPAHLQQLRFRFLGQVRAFALTYLSFGEVILALARGNGLQRPIHRTDHQTDFSFDG